MRYFLLIIISFSYLILSALSLAPPPYDEETETILTFAEVMPKYKGCENLDEKEAYECTMRKIQQYIMTLEYPAVYFNEDIDGKIFISFIVDEDCQVIEVELLKGIGTEEIMNNTAVNHIKNMPAFERPGYQNNKPVKIKYVIPIYIRLG